MSDQDPERTNYIKNIFEFIDYSIDIIEKSSKLNDLLSNQDWQLCPTVILGPDLVEKEIEALVAAADQMAVKPAFIRIDGKGKETWKPKVSQQFQGMLSLPTRYDILADILHKAQIYQEQQQSGGAREKRPLELFRSLSGNSRATRQINKMIEQVADTEATVLILGDSGGGKTKLVIDWKTGEIDRTYADSLMPATRCASARTPSASAIRSISGTL